MDTVSSDTPAVDSGVTAAQLFVGRKSLVVNVYGLKTDKEIVNTLEDNVRERGAMDKLISNCATAKSSNHVKQIWCNQGCNQPGYEVFWSSSKTHGFLH
jgi:hypothetical protein